MSVVTFMVFPLSGFYVARTGRRMRKISTNTQSVTVDFMALLSQTFQGIRHVKAYGMEKMEEKRSQILTEDIYHLSVKGYRLTALTSPIMEFLAGSLAVGAVFMYGGWQADQGQISTGQLISFITSFLFAYDPMKRMAKVNAAFQSGLAGAQRVFAVLDVKAAIIDRPDAHELNVGDYTIDIEDVAFYYADGTQALNHIAIRVPNGKTMQSRLWGRRGPVNRPSSISFRVSMMCRAAASWWVAWMCAT